MRHCPPLGERAQRQPGPRNSGTHRAGRNSPPPRRPLVPPKQAPSRSSCAGELLFLTSRLGLSQTLASTSRSVSKIEPAKLRACNVENRSHYHENDTEISDKYTYTPRELSIKITRSLAHTPAESAAICSVELYDSCPGCRKLPQTCFTPEAMDDTSRGRRSARRVTGLSGAWQGRGGGGGLDGRQTVATE